jgi:hypothetical protein
MVIHQPILQKLRERAHIANGSIISQNESAARLPYSGPKVKSEIDELSTLGGMTRLVSRRSPSTSASETSFVAKHSSPSTRTDSQVFLTPSDSSTAWQNYTHIQNFNVNINMSDGYSHTSNPPTPVPQVDMSMLYQLPNHMQQSLKQGMQMEPMASDTYYSYQQQQYNGGYMTPHPQHMASGHQGPAMCDVNDPWQNFMAPYKT